MKKSLFFYLFAVLCTMSLFTSCSDDDDVIMSQEVSGTYEGTLDISGGILITVPSIDETVTVTIATDNTVDVRLGGFPLNIPVLGEIEVASILLDECPLTNEGDGRYSFPANATVSVAGFEAGTVSGTGIFQNGSLTLNLDAEIEGIDLDVNFSGTKIAVN